MRLSLWFAWVSCATLVVLLVLTATDVAMRYVFSAPIYGLHEVTESGLVLLVMMAIPYCSTTDGHVRMDLLDNLFGPKLQGIVDLITGTISLLVLGLLAQRSVGKALDANYYEDTTNFLEMPLWPLYALVAFGAGTYALVILNQMLSALDTLVSGGNPRNKTHD